MCNIMFLPPGVNIPLDKLKTVVYNNPHGYGLILKDKQAERLQVIRKCWPVADPKEIHDLLEDNKDIERYLHVRWRTDGPIDMDNTHPFPSFISDSRQVYFMHNGILHEYKPKGETFTYENNVKITHPGESVSDSRKFNDEFLAPYLLRHEGNEGKADINDPIFQKVLDKMWTSGSKGLLVSNNQDPVFINIKAWRELDFGEGKFWSSNDDYFDKLIRGPVFEEVKKKKEEEDRKERQARFHEGPSGTARYGRPLTNLKDVNLKNKEILSEDLDRIFEDYDIWTEKGLCALENITEVEMASFVEKSPVRAVELLVHVTSVFAQLYGKYERLKEHVNKGRKGEPPEEKKEAKVG